MQPRRAHVFEVKIGADTIEDVIAELRHHAQRLRMGELGSGVSGSPSGGSIYFYSFDAEWTHERYFAAIEAADGRPEGPQGQPPARSRSGEAQNSGEDAAPDGVAGK